MKEQTKRKVSILHNKQTNLCVSILRKNKRDYFGDLNSKNVTVNRTFWKIISPPFSKKAFHKECIILKENNKTIRNNEELSETFNTFFSKIVPNLDLDNNHGDNITSAPITDKFSMQSKSMKTIQTFLKLRKR